MSCYVICQRPDKTGTTGYLAADYNPRTVIKLRGWNRVC